jgi:hypothetical protein
LGPDILNLVPDPENNGPWEDEDGPSFPELNDELAAAEAAGDFLVNTEVLLPVGNSQELARVLRQKCDQEGNPWAWPIGTLPFIPMCTRYVSLMGELRSWP